MFGKGAAVARLHLLSRVSFPEVDVRNNKDYREAHLEKVEGGKSREGGISQPEGLHLFNFLGKRGH